MQAAAAIGFRWGCAGMGVSFQRWPGLTAQVAAQPNDDLSGPQTLSERA